MGNAELREALTELVGTDGARLRADAAEARCVSYLAHHYRALDADDPIGYPVAGVSFEVIAAEGTPAVSDFLMLEIAAARGITGQAASELVSDVLNIQYRHPELWQQVLAAQVPLWIARRAAQQCHHLSVAAAKWVDGRWTRRQAGLPTSRTFKVLRGLIVQADPGLAAERAAQWRRSRYVSVGRYMDGVTHVSAQVDVLDGLFVDAQVTRIAEILQGDGVEGSSGELRAKALGVLATPARALAMLQRAAQPALTDDCAATADAPVDAAGGWCSAGRGHVCGAVTVSADQLLPKLDLVVHISDRGTRGNSAMGEAVVSDVLERLVGAAARIDGVGEFPALSLGEVLSDVRVTVRPVIDLNETPSVDRYEIPRRSRFVTRLRHPFDVFPFSNLRSCHLDLDHTTAWRRHGPPGQTAVDNLAPVSRRAHRAKTCGAWSLSRDDDGELVWESPLGYRYAVTPVGTFRCGAPPDPR